MIFSCDTRIVKLEECSCFQFFYYIKIPDLFKSGFLKDNIHIFKNFTFPIMYNLRTTEKIDIFAFPGPGWSALVISNCHNRMTLGTKILNSKTNQPTQFQLLSFILGLSQFAYLAQFWPLYLILHNASLKSLQRITFTRCTCLSQISLFIVLKQKDWPELLQFA